MERIDCHTHTYLSGHGEGRVLDVAASAAEKGISALALTEHFMLPEGIDPQYGDSMSDDQLLTYVNDVMEARVAFPDMDIRLGAEVDWLDNEDWLLENLFVDGKRRYEYVIGSIHFIDGWFFDHPDYSDRWDTVDVDAVWQRYGELWCKAVQSSVPFDTMAHPDILKKEAHLPTDTFDLRGLYADMAATAAQRGVAVEVNTAGLYKPVREQYPALDLLKAFCQAGVDCTIGSDAHCPADVGRGIDKAARIMYEAGYREVMVPTASGDRRFIVID